MYLKIPPQNTAEGNIAQAAGVGQLLIPAALATTPCPAAGSRLMHLIMHVPTPILIVALGGSKQRARGRMPLHLWWAEVRVH